MEVMANSIADDEEVEVMEEHYLLDPDIMDGQDEEMEQIDVRENTAFSNNSSLSNLNKITNINQTTTRESASFLCNSSQVYSDEQSEEWSSQDHQGLDESELGTFHESNIALHDCSRSHSSLTNLNMINTNQVYSEQSEEWSSQDHQDLDESELGLLHGSGKALHDRNSSLSSVTNPNVVIKQLNSERSEERSSQGFIDLDESEVGISGTYNNDLHNSNVSRSLTDISVVSTVDHEHSEQLENLSDHELTDFDEFIYDDSNDDAYSESSISSSVLDYENFHDDQSYFMPSNSIIGSIHHSNLESEFENFSENESLSYSLQNCDSDNDGQNFHESSPTEGPTDISSIISGCRIVDIGYFIKEFTKLGKSKNHLHYCARRGENFHCFAKLDIGLNTLLSWRCLECKMIAKIYTNPPKPENELSINETASINVIGSASSFASFQTVLAVFDIPYITHKTYEKHRKKMIDPLTKIVAEKMHLNALEEAEIAIKNGDVTSDGTPYIKVITDGFYPKRSFRGGKHDSLAASVAIIGCATQKILDVEVLNKYCFRCRLYQNRKVEPPPHKCYMNYPRDKSSSSMEPYATTILFNRSLKFNGLIYQTMVSDDDSGTYKSVRDSKPYEAFGMDVERIKCSYHIFRSVGTKIREAARITIPNRRVPASVRNRIKFSGLKIRQIVTADIERLRKDFESDNLSKADKMEIFQKNTEVLRKNILLAPYHVFGDHDKCPHEWSCDKSKPNHLTKIKEYGLFTRIEKIVTDLSTNAMHLLHFLNTNKIEQYHGILAKYLSGKRIQYGGADELQDRVYMGTLDQMTSGTHISTLLKFCKKKVPERIEKLEKERNTQRLINTKFREVNKPKKKNKRTFCGPDKDYGPNATQPDLCETDPVHYPQYKEAHHNKLRERQLNRTILEAETKNHPFGKPHSYEQDMIPSILFGKICRMLDTTSCIPVVNDICNPFVYHDDVLLSVENHRVAALRLLESRIGCKIQRSGIFVSDDAESYYLCARPDGLVNDDSIVIVYQISDDEQTNVETALGKNRNMKNIFAKKSPNEINTNHTVYYIIQGQLHVTNKQFCYFAAYTPNDLKIATLVTKNDDFWKNNMKNKLNRFYHLALIDEIIDSRLARSMPIREASFTIEAKAKKSQKEAEKLAKTAQQPSSAQDCPVNLSLSTNSHDQDSLNNYRALVLNRPIEEYRENIIIDNSYLDDLSISRFLLLLEDRNFTIHLPITAVAPLGPSISNNDLLIIGGHESFQHWCCLYFDGQYVAIYDSLNRKNFIQLSDIEKKYLQIRYPQQLIHNKVIFKLVTPQPDGSTCGIYAAAYATTIVLGGDPCKFDYSQNATAMRDHFFQIIYHNQVVQFPCTPKN